MTPPDSLDQERADEYARSIVNSPNIYSVSVRHVAKQYLNLRAPRTVTPEQIETAIAPRPCGDFVGDGMRCDQPKGHDGRHSNRNW